MEIEQIMKQVDWLDEERRKDKTRLASLEERLAALEGNLSPVIRQIKDVEGETTRLATLVTRIDHFDESLANLRLEIRQSFEELEKQRIKRDEESEKIRRAELRALEVSLAELRKELEVLPEIKRGLKARSDEEARLGKLIDEVRVRIETLRRSDEEYTRSYRLLEDGRRQDTKRLNDLQGEVSALRKRVDENRGRIELNTSSIKKVETRLNEIAAVEAERRDMLTNFLETQALQQVERERVWKEWQARFAFIEQQTAEVENNLQTLDATHRAVKRSQQSVDELAQKVERRINEITEIQRLAEERFRQEWVTFKADDQKRWTNYTITQDEQRGELLRTFERLAEKVSLLEDSLQEIQDLTQQMNELTEKRLQNLLASVHDWANSFERAIGRSR